MGDALTRSGRIEEANEAFSKALELIDEILPDFPALSSNGDDEIEVDRALAVETAELWGERGGVLRRLGRLEDARRSYAHGAAFEEVHDLPSTYNRVNALKLGLMTGQTLASISTAVAAARDALQVRLSSDERAADDAWLWSDLGDLQLLLGDVDEALSAYRIFVARARTDSPGLTLSVLQDVAEALERNGDPSAGIVKSGAVQVEMEMAK
jgi:tetratricopeptide (TPR) repeat protein